jgi:hypothetical protein
MLMNTGSIIRYESCEPARQGSPPQFTSRLRLNVTENLAAAFDLDLAVADRPRDPAGRLDQEPVADDQITFEAAAYIGLVATFRCDASGRAAVIHTKSKPAANRENRRPPVRGLRRARKSRGKFLKEVPQRTPRSHVGSPASAQ